MRRTTWSALASSALAVAAVTVAAVALPSASRAQTIAITGGTVYPVNGPKIENGTVLITNGRITAVGAGLPIPAGAARVDATGKWVTPGLVVGGATIGLAEAGGPQFSGGYNDARARGTAGVSASWRVWEGTNPASTFFRKNVQAGVTTVVQVPQGAGWIGGQAAVLNLAGNTIAEMLVKAPVAMMASMSPEAAGAASRGELLARMRAVLADAKAYGARRVQYESGNTRSFALPKQELEALQPVVNGTMPLVMGVDRASDIRAALAIGREFGLKLVVAGAAEGWQVAAELAAAKVPVMVGAMSNIPQSFDQLAASQENAARLRRAGVSVILVNTGPGDSDAFNVQNIRQEAGNAVAYGMSWDDALRAITLAPAEVMGVADRVGSLAVGREANVVVWSGDPFEFATSAERVYIRGVLQTGESRQDELMKRYRTPGSPGWFERP
ncbi:MAG: amidohydrolase family protein [Gemmatimonadota bacterium]|jgi:imidazolonepropionase-like amidohydrolase|nr:amidohydrolase family protein [Gemmatimonadota bacterium]